MAHCTSLTTRLTFWGNHKLNNLTNPNATKKNLTKEILTITRKKKSSMDFCYKMDGYSIINKPTRVCEQ